jgi:hypothetical protein
MQFLFDDVTDEEFTELLQGYKLIRVADDDSGILDVRRYCWKASWRLSNQPIIAYNESTGVNCTAFAVDATTPAPVQVDVLFHIISCYRQLVLQDICADPNTIPIFVGFSTTTNAPQYIRGCAPNKICSDVSPDHNLFIGTTTTVIVAFVSLVIGIFVCIYLMKRHINAPLFDYAMLPRS